MVPSFDRCINYLDVKHIYISKFYVCLKVKYVCCDLSEGVEHTSNTCREPVHWSRLPALTTLSRRSTRGAYDTKTLIKAINCGIHVLLGDLCNRNTEIQKLLGFCRLDLSQKVSKWFLPLTRGLESVSKMMTRLLHLNLRPTDWRLKWDAQGEKNRQFSSNNL